MKNLQRKIEIKEIAGIVNPNGIWVGELFDWSKDEIEEFMKNNMQRIAGIMEPRDNAKYYMDKLLSEEHELYLVSHRAYPHYTDPLSVTLKWLKENDINYTKLILSNSIDKSTECKQNGIDIMFDDNKVNCIYLESNGVNCYLMKTKYNLKDVEMLKIVNNWEELYNVVNLN